MTSPVVRLLVVDAHPLVRWALVHLADGESDLAAVGETGDAATGFELARTTDVDVVTIDCGLPDGLGWQLAARIKDTLPDVGVVMLAAEGSDELLLRALDMGLRGFVVKSAPVREVVSVLRHAASSLGSFTASGLNDALRRRHAGAQRSTLSPRELEVLQMLQEGLSVPAVAARLFVSLSTAKTYVARVYDKLGANNRAQALMTAVRLGLLAVDAAPVAV
jgi:DNA-binding NarL/FixJ family response regulator